MHGSALSTETGFSFLSGGSRLGALIAGFDWGASPLGAISQWPQVVKTTAGLILR